MAVEVANVDVVIAASRSLLPRVDLVCLVVWDGLLRVEVVHGTPSVCPCPPARSGDLLPVATVRIGPFAITVDTADIEEIRP